MATPVGNLTSNLRLALRNGSAKATTRCAATTTTGRSLSTVAASSSSYMSFPGASSPSSAPSGTRKSLHTLSQSAPSSLICGTSCSTIQPTTTTNNNTSARRWLSSNASKRDFYDILGVGKSSDKGEIKKAYFKLAKQYHPDTNKVRTT